MNRILNIATYKFVVVDDPSELAGRLRESASVLNLVGTVLVAVEGLNLFVAGEPGNARRFVAGIRDDARFHDLHAKESRSLAAPFRRLLVKVKREIIRMDCPAVRPEHGRAPAIGPRDLRRWLDRGTDDDGRPVVMLDARNGFECDAGRFAGTLDWRLSRFGDFPAALDANRADLVGKTVVTYCTGGIRCEKAALLMHARGIDNVYQLEGGVLDYFQALGDARGAPHWQGECFVFDERIAVDPALQATAAGTAA